eukprot:m.161902 g.161902  ORF g.161902 m.161902 type:complete len:425 (+) comp15193_c0_seq4:27-1301(+)
MRGVWLARCVHTSTELFSFSYTKLGAVLFSPKARTPASWLSKMASSNSGDKSAAEAMDSKDDFIKVKEGSATILFPNSNEVFYNPVQELNRDLTVAVLNQFSKKYREEQEEKKKKQEAKRLKREAAQGVKNTDKSQETDKKVPGLRILEALSASGLRSVRYWKEVEGIDQILANDFSAAAVENIKRNLEYNGIDPSSEVIPNQGDAAMYMHMHHASNEEVPFNVVDLDPYGSAAPFLDSAVQCVADSGLLCVTCTDMAVLAGNHAEACYAKYGCIPLKAKYCHEAALRIILASIATHAARYKRYIVPIISCSIDFYIRVFVRVYTSAAEVKKTSSKMGMVYHCMGCGAFNIQVLLRIVSDVSLFCTFSPYSRRFKKETMPSSKQHKVPQFHRLANIVTRDSMLAAPFGLIGCTTLTLSKICKAT